MPWKGPTPEAEFPSLGPLIDAWITQHCVQPDGFDTGEPFVLSDGQYLFISRHYALKPDQEFRADGKRPALGSAFQYRRSQMTRAQKWGKNPMAAAIVCVEAVGPALFAGWAEGGEAWDCRERGCPCGWRWEYEPGEPMAMQWPTPLIQLTATSEDQVANTWDVLRPMIELGPLHKVLPKVGEEFIRVGRRGRIDIVTSNAKSRLGQRVTFVLQDETGIWDKPSGMVKVAETQLRGLAGMDARAMELTNAWDPAENTVAQTTHASTLPDILKDFDQPPEHLDYSKKADRRKIHAWNYREAPWVNLDSIESMAVELIEKGELAQAERFYGNRVRAAGSRYFNIVEWKALASPNRVPPPRKRKPIVVGVDGARSRDALALVACDVKSGHLWVPQVPDGDGFSIWTHPGGADSDYVHPTDEVTAVMKSLFANYKVCRVYIDPQYIEGLRDEWKALWGKDVVLDWLTHRKKPMAMALAAFQRAITQGELSHDGNPVLAEHIGNARRRKTNIKDEETNTYLSTIGKESHDSPEKIDGAMAATLAWEARGDAIADGVLVKRQTVRPERLA